MPDTPIILPYRGRRPKIAADAFVAPGAAVIGDVEIGAESSIWFGCVIRGDVNIIRIGARTNVQDATVVHVDSHRYGTFIGDDVLIGHHAVIHACMLEDTCVVGIKACVMDGAVVEKGAMVAAGALVTPGKVVKSGQLWAGSPARHVRDLSPEDMDLYRELTDGYVELAEQYREAMKNGQEPR